MDAINLDEYIHKRYYKNTETYTQTEVIEAINNLTLIQVRTKLPTTNIRDNQIYLIPNNANLSDDTFNKYDLYIHTTVDGVGKWEQIDSLEFDIEDYYSSNQTDLLLNNKSNVGHGHENATSSKDGFMSMEDKIKLDTYPNFYVIEDNVVDTDNPVKSRAIKTSLNTKAPVNHAVNTNTYGLSSNVLYGHSMASSTTPLMDNGNGSVGSEINKFARGDHTHPTDTSRASTAPVTTSSAGLMTANDLIRLNNLYDKVSNVNFNDYATISDVQGIISGWDLGFTKIEDNVIDSSNPVKSSGVKSYVDNAINNIEINEDDLITKLNTIVTKMKNL